MGPATAERVRRVLAEMDVEHEVIAVDPALADTADFSAAYGYPLDRSANTIVVASRRGPERHAACVLLAIHRLDVNGVVKRELGTSKASFADPESTRRLTGMEIGGVTPLALPDDVPVWVDAAVMEHDWVILGGGDRASKIKVAPTVLTALPRARVVERLAG
ncbi:MAG: YbaK/EbsC family protein [Egibacteraceae bacterium]